MRYVVDSMRVPFVTANEEIGSRARTLEAMDFRYMGQLSSNFPCSRGAGGSCASYGVAQGF